MTLELHAEIERLKAENAELRKDQHRLEFLIEDWELGGDAARAIIDQDMTAKAEGR